MAFTSGIEQRLHHIQEDVLHSTDPEQGQVHLSAADVQWLLLLARNAASKPRTLQKKHIVLTRITVSVFFIALGLVSTAGIIWAVKAIIKLLA